MHYVRRTCDTKSSTNSVISCSAVGFVCLVNKRYGHISVAIHNSAVALCVFEIAGFIEPFDRVEKKTFQAIARFDYVHCT